METIGPKLFERDWNDPTCPRIATVFPHHGVLFTDPAFHALQRTAFVVWLSGERRTKGLPELPPDELEKETAASVSLIRQGNLILIRPDQTPLEAVLDGDAYLQTIPRVDGERPKPFIRYVLGNSPAVEEVLRQRGELWRMAPQPKNRREIQRYIEECRLPIGNGPAGYYHNPKTGTRYLTCENLARLGDLDDAALTRQMVELARWHRRCNAQGQPELEFVGTAPNRIWPAAITEPAVEALAAPALRGVHAGLLQAYRQAVEPDLRTDNPLAAIWRNTLFACLAGDGGERHSMDEVLKGISPEFHLQVEWLPGGRIADREFIFDDIYPRPGEKGVTPAVQQLCQPLARAVIFNYVREHTDLEYLNLGRVDPSVGAPRNRRGRRAVFLVEFKVQSETSPRVHVLRFQKWGIRERLDQGKSLEQAFIETDDYTEYILDRRLGCRQLGMNLPHHFTMHRVQEIYDGPDANLANIRYQVTFFERAYIQGIASDKLPEHKLQLPGYAVALARLLGQAAAPNLIVGRMADDNPPQVIFDNGDEIIQEGIEGLPADLVVGDHSSSFNEYRRELVEFARAYAEPVRRRKAVVPERDRQAFEDAYLQAFETRFRQIQLDYASRQRAFDGLFAWARYDPNGSFAYRWEKVLERLARTDARQLADEIRRYL